MKRWRAALPLLLLLATGLVLFLSGALDSFGPQQLLVQHDQLQQSILRHPWISRLAFTGLLTLVIATGIPASVVLTVASGLLFGIVQGTLLSTVGVVLGSVLLFVASRFALGGPSRHVPALVERLRHGYAHHPTNYTLFLRLVPGLPWGGVTVALAWLRCPMSLFVGATALGAVVMSVIESTIGAGIGDGLSRGERSFDLYSLLFDPHILLALGALALLALLPLLFGRLHRTPRRPGREE